MPTHHEIAATPDMLVWGTLAATTPPALIINSGDTVTIHAVPAGGAPAFPPDASEVPAVYRAAVEGVPQGPGAHFVTGPVYVRGAEPGDMLQVDILAAEPNMDWGFVSILPLLGTLPDEFTEYETIHPTIDGRAASACCPGARSCRSTRSSASSARRRRPNGAACTANVPRAFGGNMDNKELQAGTTFYLPVFNEGALFSPATATACRATARSASPRWRPA